MRYRLINIKSKNKNDLIREMVWGTDVKKELKGGIIDGIKEFETRFNKSFWEKFVILHYTGSHIEESQIILGLSKAGFKYNYYDNSIKHIFILIIANENDNLYPSIISFYIKMLSDDEIIERILEYKGELLFEDILKFKPEEIIS